METALPPIGSRVKLVNTVERYPHFIALEGATGSVVYTGDTNLFAVRLDETLNGAEDWDNEVHWFLEEGDDPTGDVEQIGDYVNREWLATATYRDLCLERDAGGPTDLIDAVRATIDARFGATEKEGVESERAYEIASADVVLTLTHAEAGALADLVALERDKKPREFDTDADFEEHMAFYGSLLDRLLGK